MGTLPAVIESLRPTHWVKNLLVFAALVFGMRAADPSAWWQAIFAFVLFCAASSGVYLLNDVRDREADRRHPLKRNRPVASGRILPGWAAGAGLLLMGGAVGLGVYLGTDFQLTVAGYSVLQILYSFGLKQVVLIDVLAVALGFVLRAVGGAFAVAVPISPWLLVCSLTLALFLALAKRRHEVILLELSAREHRASLNRYSQYFLDQLIGVTTATTVIAYALYTLSPDTVAKFGTQNLVFTLPFVIYGVFRYLFLVHEREEGGNPTRMFLTDAGIVINTAAWLAVSAWIIYS